MALVGFVTTAATLFVTVSLFTAEWIRRRVAPHRENRRTIIMRTLDTLDRAVRIRIRSSILPIGPGVELEYTILLPRLLADLPRKDRQIAGWVASEIQRMQRQPSDKQAFEIAVGVSAKLVDWYRGRVDRAWFQQALVAQPYDPHFVQPGRVKLARQWNAGVQWFKLTTLSAIGIAAITFTVRSFRKKP